MRALGHYAALFLGTALLAAAPHARAQSGETMKIAFIDPISGPFANIGLNILREYQLLAEREGGAGNAAGIKFEIMPFDSKSSPQEAVNALNVAIGQGARYVTQGMSSAVAAALSDAVAKHNERNPGKEVVFLDYGNADPELTNGKCNYWYFRFQTDVAMISQVMAEAFKASPATKSVYLINQNYAFGQQFSKYTREMLAKTRPDIKIAGDDYVALGQVKDFSPYVAKIKASGADAVATSSWGLDLTLLIKAARDAGLQIDWYAARASAAGTPTVIGPNDGGRIRNVDVLNPNIGGDIGKFLAEYKVRYKDDVFHAAPYQLMKMLPVAATKAKSTDPVKIAAALEGLTVDSFGGPITMRPDDHQLQQTQYLSMWQKADKSNAYDVENTGFTWAPVGKYEAAVATLPTTCKMKRPM